VVRKVRPRSEKGPRKPVGWRAREWQRLLDARVYGSRAELARAEGVSRAAVTQALRKALSPVGSGPNALRSHEVGEVRVQR
jgi:hypothetical protein